MGIFRQLIFVEAAALTALLVVAAAIAAFGVADSLLHDNSLLGPTSSAQVGFGYTAMLGLLPVVLVGAPGYVVLLRRNLASWRYVFGLGIAPGLVATAFHITLGIWAIVCGASVAALTHIMCRRLGPNYSFKPTSLRDAA